MRIVPAEKSDLKLFFSYLENHISENGQDDSYLFQPASKDESWVTDTTKERFENGFSIDFGNPGWRKLWLAKDEAGNIKGHIDLRHHSHESCYHRFLLGMGVDSSCRKKGIGLKLIDVVSNFCKNNEEIAWIDLCVLSENIPAKNLYIKAGFTVGGEFQDQYRIDGKSVSETAMTKSVQQFAY